MTTFVSDTFTDTDNTPLTSHTGETGATWANTSWSVGSPVPTIQSNQLSGETYGVLDVAYYTSGVPGSADYTVTEVWSTSTAPFLGGPGARMSTAATTGYFALRFSGAINLFKYVAGSLTQLGSAVTFTWEPCSISITVAGSSITARVQRSSNGDYLTAAGGWSATPQAAISEVDTDITAAGKAGFWHSTQMTSATDPVVASFTAADAEEPELEAIDVTDANVFFSPYNWYSDGGGALQANNVHGGSTFAQSNNPGAYLKTKLDVSEEGPCALTVDTSNLAGVTAEDCPTLAWSIDGGAPSTYLLEDSATSVTLGTLTAGSHTIAVWFKSTDVTSDDRWSDAFPALAVRITGITAPAGTVTEAPALRSRTMLVFGDSITEGVHNLGGTTGNDGQNAGYTWVHFVAAALDAEVGVVGFGSQSFTGGGAGGVPAINSSYNLYSASKSRLISGAFSPAPDLIVVNEGENNVDGAGVTTAVETLLDNLRAAAPSAQIFLLYPFTGKVRSSLDDVTLPDANTHRVDVQLDAGDGSHLVYYPGYQTPLHPSIPGSANLAGRIAAELLPHLTGASFGSFGTGRL